MLLSLRAIGEHGLRTGTHQAPEEFATVDANLRDAAVLQVLAGVAAELGGIHHCGGCNATQVSCGKEERGLPVLAGVRENVEGSAQFINVLLILGNNLCHSAEI